MNFLLRILLIVGGLAVAAVDWPVANGAWRAQHADNIAKMLQPGKPVRMAEVLAGLGVLDRAVAADPVARRQLQRSEFLATAAIGTDLKVPPEQQTEWLRRARVDLERGLANAPARGADWLRLAVVRQVLDGPSRDVVAPLLMSIRTAPMLSWIWPARLRIIIDNWGYLTDEQREVMRDNVVKSWRHTGDRRIFGWAIREPVDEMIVRFFLRNEPGAQEELTKWILATRPK